MFYSGSFHGFFGFRVFSGSLSDFFFISGAPAGGKRNPHPNPVLCGSGTGQPMGAKMNLNPHPSGLKPTGNLKSEAELSSLSSIIYQPTCVIYLIVAIYYIDAELK
jgi:hypothetical protein